MLSDLIDVVTGDGHHKLAIMYNYSIPGPPIVVYENQQVKVNSWSPARYKYTSTKFWHPLLYMKDPEIFEYWGQKMLTPPPYIE